MINAECLEKALPDINAFSKDEVKLPESFRTYGEFALESNILYRHAGANKDALLAHNMDWNKVEKIPIYSGALRELLSKRMVVKFVKPEHQKKWDAIKVAAVNLVDKILIGFTHAFSAFPELMQMVKKIKEGTSNENLVQDLNDCAVVGKSNIDLLKAIEFDLSLLDQSAALSTEASELLELADMGDGTPNPVVMRDKVYTMLRQIIDSLIEKAEFVFSGDADTLKKFALSKAPKKKAKTTKASNKKEDVEPANA